MGPAQRAGSIGDEFDYGAQSTMPCLATLVVTTTTSSWC